MAHIITDADFEMEVIQSPLPVIVDFYADWCGPCRMMGPIIDELSAEYAGKAKFVKLNADTSAIAQQLGVMSLPTFAFFRGGKPVKAFAGATTKASFKQVVDSVLAQEASA